jgi:hypothetical protein
VASSVVVAPGAAAAATAQRRLRRISTITTPTLRRYSLYQLARKNGVPINTQFLVKLGLSTNPVAARKMINRDVHSGILTAIATWPRTYKLAQENVTSLYAASTSRPRRTSTVQKRQQIRAQIPSLRRNFTPNNSNSSSLRTNEDILVRDADLLRKKRIEQHRERCRRYHRRKRQEKQKALVYYQEAIISNVAAHMTDTLVLSAASSAAGGLSALLHGHNFSFQTFLDDAALASRLSSTYRRIDGSKAFFIDWFMRVKNGVRVKNKVYPKSRYVQIQPCMTESPIAIRDLPSFMDDIRDKLSSYLPTPPTDSGWWLLTSIDLHVPDWDVTDQEEKNEEWVKALDAAPILRNLEDGSKFHVYLKRYAGRTYVRMELMQLQPDMTYSEFVATYIDQDLAGKKFSEAILSLLLLLTSQYQGPMESPCKMRRH